MGEQAAIESLRRGATDYVLKQWPERLVPAVRRALQESRERVERLRAETGLLRQERYFRALTENSLDVLTILSGEGLFLYNSPSLKRVLGYARNELAGRSAFSFVHPEDLPNTLKAFEEALAHPERRVTQELRFKRADGSWCHLEVVGQNCLADPHIGGVVLNSRDVTERKQAEARLRLQSAALESTANAILITDRQGAVVWANTAFSRLTGYSMEEIFGKNPRFLKSGEHDQSFYEKLWGQILSGQVWQAEMINRRKDGTQYSEESTITPVRDDTGQITHFIAVKQDVTARKELEAQLRQSQKMEAIGQLAGGVAHDFNNLLLVIGGNAELALMHPQQLGEEARKCIDQITTASKRASNLVSQLLAFSRKQVIQPRKLCLNNAIRELTRMLHRIIGENIHLECELTQQLPFVQADAGMIDQVLVNLVVNARDAMPGGGRLLIGTDTITLDESYCRSQPEARPGQFVRLSVSDSGSGIKPEHLPRIFEPFFTTKESGKGTGLGLATVYGIVKQHQGWIEVSSKVGAGTRFSIFLPVVEPPSAESSLSQTERKRQGGTAKILLVEDDLAVRRTTRRILEAFGYKVREATSGAEALEIWKEHGAEVDLLLTDIVMPEGVTGLDLAKRLRGESPRLKVLFTTGYTTETAGKDTEFMRRNRDFFLQKPYRTEELLEKIRQCLEQQ
jgi:PAS domain S-box-containing protein